MNKVVKAAIKEYAGVNSKTLSAYLNARSYPPDIDQDDCLWLDRAACLYHDFEVGDEVMLFSLWPQFDRHWYIDKWPMPKDRITTIRAIGDPKDGMGDIDTNISICYKCKLDRDIPQTDKDGVPYKSMYDIPHEDLQDVYVTILRIYREKLEIQDDK